jgi:aminopeptidase N
VGLLAAAAPAWSDTYPRQPGIDVEHYTFHLTLSDATDAIEARADIDARVVQPDIRVLRLDLASRSPGRGGKGMDVGAVRVEGAAVRVAHENDRLEVALPPGLRAGDRVRIGVTYRGTPAAGLLIAPNKHGDRTFFSDNWPTKAREWLAVVDHPYDKAAATFLVTAPAHYQVVSNGRLVEETDLPDGTRLTAWQQSVPIAPWLYVLGAARFAVQHLGDFGGRPVQTWVYRQDRDAGFHDFAVPTMEALAFFDRAVGPYPYEKLANVQANGVRGGMESATAIFYGDDSVTGQRTERWRNVIVHEIAHQWFGNSVTETDWDDVWLSEGFATYFTLLFIEHAYGHDAFLAGVRRSRDQVRAFEREHPGYRIVHDELSDMAKVLSSQIYQKGGWVLHMLRGMVGDEAFWTGIRAYYRSYRDRNASTDDFRREMERASGRELGWFFNQWLTRGGWLRVDGTWSYDAAAGAVRLVLDQQSTDGRVFRVPMQVAVRTPGKAPDVVTIELRESRTDVSIPCPAEPDQVTLDPDTWVLMEASLTRR